MAWSVWRNAGRADYRDVAQRRRNKYAAQRCWCDLDGGHWHASLKERQRCHTLTLEAQAGLIQQLERQPRYPLRVNGVTVADYVADFTYQRQAQRVVEDVKSVATRTPVYRLKRKLMAALYGIDIVEV
jgi:hypothetical protein